MRLFGWALLAALPAMLVGSGTALAASPTSSPADGWSAPLTLDRSIYWNSQPQVAYAANGDAVLTWDGRRGLSVSTRVAGGAWAKPIVLTDAQPYDFGGPRAAIDSHGNATVVWRDESTCNCVRAASHRAGADWSVVDVTTSAGTPEFPDVAAYGDGSALAVWDIENSQVEYTVMNAAGTWSKPHRLMKGYVPRVAADAQGDLVISALTDGTGTRRIEAVFRAAGSPWGKVTRLSPANESVASPAVAINQHGLAAVTWEGRGRHGLGQAFASVATVSGGTWSDESILSSRDDDATSLPTVAVDDVGRAFVAWGKRVGPDRRIQTAMMSRAGSWGSVSTISPAGVAGISPVVAAVGHAPAVIAWEQFDGTKDTVQSSVRTGRVWEAPSQVSADDTLDDLEPSLAMDGAGHLTATWVGYPTEGPADLLVSDGST